MSNKIEFTFEGVDDTIEEPYKHIEVIIYIPFPITDVELIKRIREEVAKKVLEILRAKPPEP